MKIKLLVLFAAFAISLAACKSSAPTPTEITGMPTGALQATAALPTPAATPTLAPTATQAAELLPSPTSPPPPAESLAPTPTLQAPQETAPPSPTAATSSPEPTQVPGTGSGAAAPAPTGETCTDIAAYFGDITIPDGASFRQGDTFVKTWRIKNAGTCAWNADYALVFAGGEVMNAPLANPLDSVPPGGIADISIDLTAPPRGGTYRSVWEFQSPSGERFGVGSSRNGPLWAEISVAFFLPTPESPGGSQNPPESPGAGSQPTPEAVSGSCPATRDQGYEQQVLSLINQGRASLGLPPLTLQPQLTAAAVAHSTDMACNNFVNHIGSDGNLWYARVESQGYANYNSSRENIYVGNPEFGGTPSGAYTWWFNSSVHYDNMFNPDVSEIGIGYVSNPQADYVGYYTTVFARP